MCIPSTKKQTIELAKNYNGSAAFADSSSRIRLVVIETYWQNMRWPAAANTISDTSTLSNSLGEQAGIEVATAQIWSVVKYNTLSDWERIADIFGQEVWRE